MDPRIDPSRYLRDDAIEDFRTYRKHHHRGLAFGMALLAMVIYFATKDALHVPTPRLALGSHAALLLVTCIVVGRDLLTGRREGRLLLRRAVLATLAANGPSYGLELRQKIGIGASIYVHLREMEDEGLLASEEREGLPCRGGLPRRYYRVVGAKR